jgi:hypothetical protein
MLIKMLPFKEKGWELPHLADSRWELLLKLVGQPQVTPKTV